ncbi:MAG: hypothetical protein ACRDYA_19655 [Egibacteraceae bacterium]
MLLLAGASGSVPSLSLEPVLRHSHDSPYEALARGGIGAEPTPSAGSLPATALWRPTDRRGLALPMDPQLGWAADSPTAPLALSASSSAYAATATITQVRGLVRRLGSDGPVPLFRSGGVGLAGRRGRAVGQLHGSVRR